MPSPITIFTRQQSDNYASHSIQQHELSAAACNILSQQVRRSGISLAFKPPTRQLACEN